MSRRFREPGRHEPFPLPAGLDMIRPVLVALRALECARVEAARAFALYDSLSRNLANREPDTLRALFLSPTLADRLSRSMPLVQVDVWLQQDRIGARLTRTTRPSVLEHRELANHAYLLHMLAKTGTMPHESANFRVPSDEGPPRMTPVLLNDMATAHDRLPPTVESLRAALEQCGEGFVRAGESLTAHLLATAPHVAFRLWQARFQINALAQRDLEDPLSDLPPHIEAVLDASVSRAWDIATIVSDSTEEWEDEGRRTTAEFVDELSQEVGDEPLMALAVLADQLRFAIGPALAGNSELRRGFASHSALAPVVDALDLGPQLSSDR